MQKILINLGASLTYALVQWLIITIISREMSVSDAGIYAFYLAIFSPLSILCSLGIRNNIATDINREYSDNQYYKLRNIGLITYFSVFLIIFYFFNKNSFILCSIFLFKLVDLISELTYGSWIRAGLVKLYGISRLLKSSITLMVMIICLWSLNYSDKLIYVYFFISLVVIVLLDNNKKIINLKNKIDTEKKGVISLLIFSLPLIFSAFIVSFNVSIPRFVLSSIGMKEVAMYTMLTYFGSIAIMPLMSTYPVYMSKISDKSKDRLPLLKKITFFTLIYSILYLLFIIFFSKYIMIYIYKIDGLIFIDYLFAGLGGVCQLILVLQNFIITCNRKFSILFRNNLINIFILTALSIGFTYFYSLTGCLIAFFVSNMIMVMMNLKEILKFNFSSSDV